MKKIGVVLVVLVLGIGLASFEFSDPKIRIFVWMDPECPISQKLTKSIKDLDLAGISAQVTLVFPRPEPAAIQRFRKKFQIAHFHYLTDPKGQLASNYRISTTPEVCVVDEQDSILYSGAIDNSCPKIGVFKQPTAHYLAAAIKDIAHGHRPVVSFVKPVGCLIQSKQYVR